MALPNEVNAQIGANIKRLRKKLDISSTTLADAINVSQSTISGWENGKVFPRSSAIEKMAQYFGVEKSELLIDEREMAIDIGACLLSKHPIKYRDRMITNEERRKIFAITKAVLGIE